jgi:hypothetical protein
MSEFKGEEFEFPDEKQERESKNAVEPEFNIEIEDDTPAIDRNRTPVNAEIVKKLEVETDDLDQYSQDAKEKIVKMKHIWHDERRAKEAAMREQQEAINLAQKLMADNERMKKMLKEGESDYKKAKKESAKNAIKSAEQRYKEAYESGDSKKLLEAQQDLTNAQFALDKAKKFKLPPLQEENFAVQQQYQAPQPVPQPDRKVMDWQNRNSWFGQDEEMTAAALGLHEKMKRTGVSIGSDEYYDTLDKTIRRRFPENFDSEVKDEPKQDVKAEARTKPSTVVAPATRSTSPKTVRLKTSQMALIKKLGITPEQYAKQLKELES